MRNETYVVQQPMAVVLRIARVAGVAPLSFKRAGNAYKISISRKWAIYSYILITLINFTQLVGLYLDFQKRVIKSKTVTSFNLVIPDVITAMLATGFGVYNGVRRMENLIRNLTLFYKVKADMNEENDEKISRITKQLTMGIIYLVSVFMFLVLQTCFNVIDYPGERLIVAAYGIVNTEYLIVAILQLQIIFSMLEACSVLELMRYKLNEVLSLVKSEKESINQKMNRIGCAYVAVCEVISNMSNLDGVITVTIFANFISSIVFTGYYCDVLFTLFTRKFAFIQLSWCCLYAIKVLVFIETFHLINREVDLIKVLTSKVILKTTDLGKRCPFNVDIMYKQLLLNKPAYTPMDIFTLNRSFIITIFSAVVTYLLFMIEFKWPGVYEQNNN